MSKYLEALTSVSKPVLMRLPPEVSHDLAVLSLNLMPLPEPDPVSHDPRLETFAFGRFFPNPIGLAAGFDKNGQIIQATRKLGFGFTEVGSVTPLPQVGNVKPRLWRRPELQSIINHMGMNSDGIRVVRRRLDDNIFKGGYYIVGVSLGLQRESRDPVRMAMDYIHGYDAFSPIADYVVLNVSCPNMEHKVDIDGLRSLLWHVTSRREAHLHTDTRWCPILLKISPDISLYDLDQIVALAKEYKLEGMIVSNTVSQAKGGLSGPPIFDLSTQLLAQTYLRVEKQFPLIGVGGVNSAETAWKKIAAGATLVQLLTGFIYGGLNIANEINEGLLKTMIRGYYSSIEAAVGYDAKEIAKWRK